MTAPRLIIPGKTYLITRSCAGRRLKMVPRGLITKLMRYAVALYSEQYGIEVHAIMVMSNHWHAVVTDHHGDISDFVHRVHTLVARVMNAQYRDLTENFWNTSKPSIVRLVNAEDVWSKLVYVSANPVAAALVESCKAWPGLRTLPEDVLADATDVERPSARFFGRRTSFPAAATLTITVPPSIAAQDWDAADFAAEYRRRLTETEKALCAEVKARGDHFLGVRGVRKKRRTARPKRAPQSTLSPHIACADEASRKAALAELVEFRRAHERARQRWRKGHRGVIFPYGTYQMARLHGVRCAGPPR